MTLQTGVRVWVALGPRVVALIKLEGNWGSQGLGAGSGFGRLGFS